MKPKWRITEQSNARVRFHVEYEDGEIEDFEIGLSPRTHEGLSPGTHGRQQFIHMSVEEFLADRALKRDVAVLRNRLDKMAWSAERPVSPPVLAELAISLLAPKNSAQSLLGDLQEMYQQNTGRIGEKQARRKYWMQVASSLAPLLWQWLKRLGFFTVLVDYCRSKMGF